MYKGCVFCDRSISDLVNLSQLNKSHEPKSLKNVNISTSNYTQLNIRRDKRSVHRGAKFNRTERPRLLKYANGFGMKSSLSS